MPLIRVRGWLSGIPAVTAVRDNAVAWAPAAPQHCWGCTCQPVQGATTSIRAYCTFFVHNLSSGFPFQAAATHCKTSRGILWVKYKEIKSRSPTKLQLHLRSVVFAGLLGQSVTAPNHSKMLKRSPSLHRASNPKWTHQHQSSLIYCYLNTPQRVLAE